MSLLQALRVVLVVAWLVSPPFLVALAVLRWRRSRTGSVTKSSILVPVAVVVVANWALFILLFIKAQTPYGVVFQTSALTHTLLFLSCVGAVASLTIATGRWLLFSANIFLITVWIVVAYAPAHWMGEWEYGKVTVDGRPTSASLFIAHPSDSEAEAIVLVHIPTVSDYFLSFGGGEGSSSGKTRIYTASRRSVVLTVPA